jgi:hypothetical protein
MERQEAAKLVRMIRAAWPRQDMGNTDDAITVYWLGLRRFSYPDVEQALVSCIEECTFLPTVSEIVARLPKVRALYAAATPATDLDALIKMLNGPGLYDASTGRYRKPDTWPSPIAKKAVDLFGWQRFQDADPDWLPREWQKVWTQARDELTTAYLRGEIVLDEHGMLVEPEREPSMSLRELRDKAHAIAGSLDDE